MIYKIVNTTIKGVFIKSSWNRIKLLKAWAKLILNGKVVAAKVADNAKKSAYVKRRFPSKIKGSASSNWHSKENVTLYKHIQYHQN